MMEDITSKAMGAIMKRAPVWAASMAGRTKVFTGDIETAHVTGGNGRFKIVINEKIANSSDLEFVLMHEIAHIFRSDLVSMNKHRHMARDINIAADCIINDTLLQMGVPKPSMADDICWGMDIYGQYCTGKSINNLLNVKKKQDDKEPSAPGDVSSKGERIEEGEGEDGRPGEQQGGGVGADEDPCKIIGVGMDPIVHKEMKPLARSVAAYARSMFFERGFNSKNMVTRLDWRRNRSTFAGRNDIIIPKTTTKMGGRESGGPLVNLVLDVSGSMHCSWVATAASIAEEIERAGLDFDLWLTPLRRKARNKTAVINALLDSGKYSAYDYLEKMSFDGEPHWGGNLDISKPRDGGPTLGYERLGSRTRGADELAALRLFETKDPVVWIYIGDYKSQMNLEMHYQKNFLHVMISDKNEMDRDVASINGIMEKESLPRWHYHI